MGGIFSCFNPDPRDQFLKQVNVIKEKLGIDQQIELNELTAEQKLLIVYNVMYDDKVKSLFNAALDKCASFKADNTTKKSKFKDFVEAVFDVKEPGKVSVFEVNQTVIMPNVEKTGDANEIRRFIDGGEKFYLNNKQITFDPEKEKSEEQKNMKLDSLMENHNKCLGLISATTNLLALDKNFNIQFSQLQSQPKKGEVSDRIREIKVTTNESNQGFDVAASIYNITVIKYPVSSNVKSVIYPFDAKIDIRVGGQETYKKEIKLYLNDLSMVDNLKRVFSTDGNDSSNDKSQDSKSTNSSSLGLN